MSLVTNLPPGPKPKMPGKLLRQFIHDPINTLSKIAREYGDMSYFRLGREHVYLINNPDYIEKVLIYDPRNFKKCKRRTMRLVPGQRISLDPAITLRLKYGMVWYENESNSKKQLKIKV